MFYSFPTETQIDILKFFNYQQLCSIKQTNLYFRDFINKFEGELSRKEFYEISIEYFDQSEEYSQKLIKPKAENFDFLLPECLEEKLKDGLESPIPLYLSCKYLDENEFYLIKVSDVKESYFLQLPTIIKSKEDIKIVYYYFKKLFNCSFGRGKFDEFIFNSELIEFLFGNVKISKQFYIKICELIIEDNNIEFIFIFNNLLGEILRIGLSLSKDFMEKYKDFLFKILTNGRDNFREVNLKSYNFLEENFEHSKNLLMIYEYIVEYLATSKDFSKFVPAITFDFSNSSNLKLPKRAEEVITKQIPYTKFTKYQISNIYNSKVIFSVYKQEKEDSFGCFKIIIIIMREVYTEKTKLI
uniref:Uncharacterized protein n=1 Tax=Meloidogyne enterolobii TaxID=390850 RepID=A0A6V7VGM1_MELEN|nr:unnamed protein product [Meloidogyne enterolobii]CAD2174099.1 unnamed protein product [Meloidogyne enterolobii]